MKDTRLFPIHEEDLTYQYGDFDEHDNTQQKVQDQLKILQLQRLILRERQEDQVDHPLLHWEEKSSY